MDHSIKTITWNDVIKNKQTVGKELLKQQSQVIDMANSKLLSDSGVKAAESAVLRMNDLVDRLRDIKKPEDAKLNEKILSTNVDKYLDCLNVDSDVVSIVHDLSDVVSESIPDILDGSKIPKAERNKIESTITNGMSKVTTAYSKLNKARGK